MFKIEPKSSTLTTPVQTGPTSSQSSARDRAMAMLSAGAPTPAALDQNQISPENSSLATGTASDVRQKNTSETPMEAAAPEAPKALEDPISTQYANLARKEKALRAQALKNEETLKSKEAAIAAREAELKAKDAEYSTKYISKDKLTTDTLNALAEAGLTYDQITELMLTANSPEKKAQSEYEKRIDAKLAELERSQKEKEKAAEQQQTAAYQQAIVQMKLETKALVEANPDFETIKETNHIDDVVELIERKFKEDGVLLSVEDAARQVEDYLVEEALKIAKIKKIQQRLSPAKPAEEMKPESPKEQPATLKTLTNAISTPGKLSRRDRAIAAMTGQLPK